MADDNKTFEYEIRAKADLSAIDQATVKQKEQIALTKEQTAANEQLAASSKEAAAAGGVPWSPAHSTSGSTEGEAAARTNAIETQGIAILETKRDLQAAIIAGNDLQAQILKGEVAIRSLTLQQMKQQVMTQTELNELTEMEAGLLRANAARAEARAAADLANAEEQAASSVERVYGPRSRTGMLLRNFLSPNMAASAGIGIFGGAMAYEAIHRYTEEMKKANDERDRASAKELEEEEHTMREIRNLDSLAEAQRMRKKLEEELNIALDERRNAPDDLSEDKRAAINQTINALQVEINAIDRANDRTVARGEASRAVKAAEEEVSKALEKQIDALDVIEQHQKNEIQFEKDRFALVTANAIKQVEQDVITGKITAEEGEKRKLALGVQKESHDFAADQKLRQQEITNEQKKIQDANTSAGDSTAGVDKAKAEQAKAADNLAWLTRMKENADNLDAQAAATQQRADEMAAIKEQTRQDPNNPFHNPVALANRAAILSKYGLVEGGAKITEANTPGAVEKANQDAEAARKAAEGADRPYPKSLEDAKQAAETANAQLASQQDNQKQNADKQQRVTEAATKRIADLQEEIKQQAALNVLKAQGNALDQKNLEIKNDKKQWQDAAKNPDSQSSRDFILKQSQDAVAGMHAQGGTVSAAALAAVKQAEEHFKESANSNTYEALAAAHLSFAQTIVAKQQHQDASNLKVAADIKRLEEWIKTNRPGGN